MADNITITSGTGVTVATDDDGGAQHQYVKIEFGADGTFTKVAANSPLPVSCTSMGITSLPALGFGGSVSVSGLTSASVSISNGSVSILSLPAFAVGSIISVSGLTSAVVSLSAGSIVSVSGLTSAIVSISNLPISVKVESLPDFSVNSIVSVSGMTSAMVSISPISLYCTVTAASIFRITSLPAIGFGGLVSISNGSIQSISNGAIVSLSPGSIISVSGLTSAIVSISNLPIGTLTTVTNAGVFKVQVGAPVNYWSFTSTYTSAQTNVVLRSETSSTVAYYITDVIFSNCSTQGDFSLVESRPNAGIRVKLDGIHLIDRGGMVANFGTPIVLDTNASICMTTRSVTSHSVTILGYTA